MAAILMLSLALPDLHELDRFPPMALVNARLGVLIEHRYYLKGQLALGDRDGRWQRLLIANDHALRCWEELLAARGGLGEEEGGRDDEEFCRQSLGRLRGLLGQADWFAGAMP